MKVSCLSVFDDKGIRAAAPYAVGRGIDIDIDRQEQLETINCSPKKERPNGS